MWLETSSETARTIVAQSIQETEKDVHSFPEFLAHEDDANSVQI